MAQKKKSSRSKSPRVRRGLLITFEGTEGAGKSTLIRRLSTALQSQGLPVTVTREPGGSALAEKIRGLILENPMHPWTELFLYEAARSEHVQKTILPALQQGQIVLCDRYTDSSIAYQGVARGLPISAIQTLNHLATQGITPRWTVWLDIDPKKGLERASDPNRFEKEGVAFQTRVRQGFVRAMGLSRKRWLRIRVENQTPDEMTRWMLEQIQPSLKPLIQALAAPKK
jgi:dTMP kinase